MRNRVLKLFGALALLLILLIPSNAYAASQDHWYISTSSYSSAIVGTSANKVGYYFGPSTYYDRFYNTFFHQITDGSTKYLGYCLDPNWTTHTDSGTILSIDNTKLYDSRGNEVTGERLKLLKNILAAGQQLGTYTDVVSFKNKTGNLEKKNFLATQILIWEVMEGGRTDYSTTLNTPSGRKNSYDFVSTDAELKNKYLNILSKAYQLSDAGKPAAFGKTYILKWNDSKNKYVSKDAISVGDYNVVTSSIPTDVSVTKDKNNNVTIEASKEVNNATDINFNIIQGTTLSSQLRWFKFSTGNTRQRMVLAYLKGSNSAKLSVKTEKGIFKINKYDLSTKKFLGGSQFTMYKCKSTASCTKVQVIDVPVNDNKAISDEITITKSGLYKFVETKVPAGYQKMNDFYLTLQIQDDGNIKILVDEKDKDYVKVAGYNSERYAHLLLYNESKSFNISKIDGNDNKTAVKGATFNIKDSKGNLVKFKKLSEGNFQYSTDGTITDLVSANLSTYTIAALPVGEYILEETNVPSGYVLSSKTADRQTKFKIDKTDFLQTLNSSGKYVKSANATITVKNYKTKVTINKTGSGGKVVEGVIFELYDSKKENRISVVLVNGQYYYNGTATTSQIVTNNKGKIVINQLPAGTYYLKEISTPADSGLVIPEDPYTKIVVTLGQKSNNIVKTISNAKGSFCFYKIDEDGNYLDQGKFKLQVYNETTSKFEDVALIQNEDKTFKIDSTSKSNLYLFTPVSGGQTCFVDINAKGRYKIVELEAPEGFVLPSNQADKEAEITINEHGYASGDAVIINKKITIGEGAEAQAELIVSISTGVDKINYIFIISGIVLILGGLLLLKKKMDK